MGPGGGGGALRRTQVNEHFRAVRPHYKADICVTRENNNHQFFIWGPQYKQMCIFGYSIYKIWKQSDKDLLNYRVNDEVSADAAAADAA